MKMKRIAMTSSSNRTSKNKHGDLFILFFLARLKISVDSRNYNLCVEGMPETDFGMPGMPENLASRACQKIWHARHAGDFAGYEFLITRT